MRHFAHNIGDYAAATAHLTFLEDAAYHRLLRRYYQDEKPLPVDPAECQRLVGARSKEEKAAVRTVLQEFFTLADDGWHQSRADREIETYHAKAEAARANGTKGGRPANQRKTQPVIPPVQSEKLTTPHSPLPTPQVGEGAPAPRPAKRASRLPDDWAVSDDGRKFATALGLDADRVAEAFRDYWRAASGSKAAKLDWDAAYRTWCRRQAEIGRDVPAADRQGNRVTAAPSAEPWEQRLSGWRKNGWWLPMVWGPKPGDAGCRVPADLLDTSPRYSATEAA